MSASKTQPVHDVSLARGTARFDRAVVVGGSMTGLAVARALSEHFREVVVVERDVLSKEAPEHRRGVQQSWHIHGLVVRGQRELEELFPGYTEEAVRLGAVIIDHGKDVARCTDVGFCPLMETGFTSISATRTLMEFAERQRFRALCKNVVLMEDTRVEDLITEGEGASLRAVGVLTDRPEAREVRGDLVVDCSGRAALWKKWFDTRNLPRPKETIVDAKTGYATRFYRPKTQHRYGWKAMTVDPLYPARPQYAVLVPVENNQWMLTFGGINEHYPPGDEAGFEAFPKTLQTPLLAQWLDDAEAISPVRTFRRMEKRWNHFESFKMPVQRFLAVGDSAWAYNPQYGQGMTIGIGCARILRDELRRDSNLDTLARRYYPKGKDFAFPPWHSTGLLDFAWPKTEGKRPWYTQIVRRVGHTFLRAAQFEDEVFFGLLQGAHLTKKPYQLLTPTIMFCMARYLFRRMTSTLPPTDLTRLPSEVATPAKDDLAAAE